MESTALDSLLLQLGREIADRLHHYLQNQSSRSLYPDSFAYQQEKKAVTARVPVRVNFRRTPVQKPFRALEVMTFLSLTSHEYQVIASYVSENHVSKDTALCVFIEQALQNHPVREEMTRRLRRWKKSALVLLDITLWDTIVWQEN